MTTQFKPNVLHISIFFLVFSFASSRSLSATTYYVSNSGNDDNTGTTPESAWKTISHVNDQIFSPGDSILFKRGGVWRNISLSISSSGNNNHPIVYGAYGSGNKPEILGSIQATGWTKVSGNIWSSATTIPSDPWSIGYDGPEIFFEGANQKISWGAHQSYNAGLSNLTTEYDWTWNNNTIYICSPADPGSRYNSVEVPQLSKGIMLLDKNYITLDGLAVKYYGDAAIYDEYATIELFGLRVTNCEIAYVGRKEGGAAYGLSVHHSDSYYAHNEIHNCGRRGISITLYNTSLITESNIIIENNHFHHGWHTTSLDCSASTGHTIHDIYFRNNFVEGSPDVMLAGENPNSNHVFVSNQSSGEASMYNFYFYNNIFTYAHASSLKVTSIDSIYVLNNTFYFFNPSLDNWQSHVFCGNSTQVAIMNNIFCNNATDNRWAAIECEASTVGQLHVDYNLYYNTDPTRRMFWVDGGTSYDAEEWDTYRSATGNDGHSPQPADPQFIQPPENLSPGENSPVIGKGLSVDWISTDYYMNLLNTPPDIGAIQSGSAPVGLPRETISRKNVSLCPNPAREYCLIGLEGIQTGSCTITIMDLRGEIVFNGIINNSNGNYMLPVENLDAGLYMVTIKNGNSQPLLEKLIVTK
jgi:hypothetical protein